MVLPMADDLTSAGGRLHFETPPIIEAVIAITFAPLPESALAALQGCVSELRALGYPSAAPVTKHQVQIRVEQGVSSAGHQDLPVGVRFTSGDSLHAVQFNRTEFVFSRLGRYDRWEPFRDEAKRLWQVFIRAVGGVSAVLVAVRFINKVFFPRTADPAEYLNARPLMPSDVAPVISEMFMRVVAPIGDPAGNFIHNQALLPPERDGFATVLLDNDFQFPAEGKADAELWEMLETVREIKDRYFVAVTTEKLRETFNA